MSSVEKLCILLLLCCVAVSGSSSSLALRLLKAVALPSSPAAVLCSSKEAALVKKLERFPIPVTIWGCLGETDCLKSFATYITQRDVGFPRPGVVFAPYAKSHLLRALSKTVKTFQKYHSNILWIFATHRHEDVLGAFSGHLCHVISVTKTEINAPLDGYMSCEERRTFTAVQDALVAERVPPRGSYSRNERIRFAMQDDDDAFCFQENDPFVTLVERAYRTLNNTFVEGCNQGETDSILLDRRVDLVLSPSDRVHPKSYYAYTVLAPDAICFLTRQGRPVRPSFVSHWLLFLSLSFVLAFVAALFLLLLSVHTRKRPGRTPGTGPFIMFFISSFLGRSSAPLRNSRSTKVRVIIIVWAVGMFFLCHFCQTAITASRSVPAYSSQMKLVSELVARLDDGTISLCVHFGIAGIVFEFGGDAPQLERVREVLRRCRDTCLRDEVKRTCIPRAQRGTHALLHRYRLFLHEKGLLTGLAVGEEMLVTYFKWQAAHTKFPLRHQHRRLLQAFEESGLESENMKRHGSPPSSREDVASFDVPFSDYVAVYATGCGLSQLVLAAEILWHRFQKRRHSHRKWERASCIDFSAQRTSNRPPEASNAGIIRSLNP